MQYFNLFHSNINICFILTSIYRSLHSRKALKCQSTVCTTSLVDKQHPKEMCKLEHPVTYSDRYSFHCFVTNEHKSPEEASAGKVTLSCLKSCGSWKRSLITGRKKKILQLSSKKTGRKKHQCLPTLIHLKKHKREQEVQKTNIQTHTLTHKALNGFSWIPEKT